MPFFWPLWVSMKFLEAICIRPNLDDEKTPWGHLVEASAPISGLKDPFWESKMAKINLERDLICPLFQVSSSFSLLDCHAIALGTLVLKYDEWDLL